MKIILTAVLFLSMTALSAQELPPDLQAGADMAREGRSERLLELMKNYRAVLEAELAEVREEYTTVKGKLDTVNRRVRAHKTWAWITIPLGIAAIGTGVYTRITADEAYKDYQAVALSDGIGSPREQAALYDALTYSLWGGGLALTGGGILSALGTPSREKLEARYQELTDRINQLEEHLE